MASETTKSMFGNRSRKLDGNKSDYDADSVSGGEGTVDKVIFHGRMPSVNVRMIDGSYTNNLAFPGGFIDPGTKNLHGIFLQPRKGMKVIIRFTNGNRDSPYISDIVFRCGESKDAQLYRDFVGEYDIQEGDILIGHFSGKSILLSEDAILISNEKGTFDRMIAYDKLSDFLKTVVGNLGDPLFKFGLPDAIVDLFYTP